MKTITTALMALSATLLATSVAFADKAESIPQCTNIATQCEAAGDMPGMHKKNGKGLWVDCVRQVAKGKSVPGVTASQADAQSCLAAHKAIRAQRKAGAAAPGVAPTNH